MICVDQLGKGTFGTVYLGYSRDAGLEGPVHILIINHALCMLQKVCTEYEN